MKLCYLSVLMYPDVCLLMTPLNHAKSLDVCVLIPVCVYRY
jgi:hypothetical protein